MQTQDALKLDSCIKRYTDWNEEERIDALDTFFRYVLDQGHRDLKDAKWNRIVRTNDKENQECGLQFLLQGKLTLIL